jgi:hypothetical protein
MPRIGLNSQYSIVNSQFNICHGDRFVPARFGHGHPFCHFSAKWEPPVGGLSQPRRDTADPNRFTIYDCRLTISIVNHNSKIENHKGYPVRQSNFFNRRNIPDWQPQINTFYKKICSNLKIRSKTTKKQRILLIIWTCSAFIVSKNCIKKRMSVNLERHNNVQLRKTEMCSPHSDSNDVDGRSRTRTGEQGGRAQNGIYTDSRG